MSVLMRRYRAAVRRAKGRRPLRRRPVVEVALLPFDPAGDPRPPLGLRSKDPA